MPSPSARRTATRSSTCSSPSAACSDIRMTPGHEHRPQYTAGELAERFGLDVHGDAATFVRGVATIADATPDRLTFLSNSKYRASLARTRAGIVVLAEADADA